MFVVRFGIVFQCVVLWWHVCGVVMTVRCADDRQNATKGVDEFLTSLIQMIGTVLQSDGRSSQSFENGEQSISGRPNRPPGGDAVADYFETGRPPYFANGPRPPYFENGPRPPYYENGPRPPYSENGPRPPYSGNGPRPPYIGQYSQQNSILQALSSISRHDDLKCVPRLLCEVSSGTRPSSSGYYQPGGHYQQQQQSAIPFFSKDALNNLLTVVMFVDESPLLMLGRATLLGYNSRGDASSCTNAYPICPRNPDDLINYLNNYKGGFFRFFNQQPPRPHQPPFPPQQPPFPPQQPPFPPQRPLYPPQQQYAAQYPRPKEYFKYGARADRNNDPDGERSPRILTGSPNQYYDVPSVNDLLLDVPRPSSMKFPSDGRHDDAANSVAPFTFPSSDRPRRGKSNAVKMVFPDRTGTGGLRAELDQYGNYKGVYYADGAIKFVDDDRRPSKIRLPPSSQSGPADHFDVIGDRLPYGNQSKFQFPRSESA